MMPNPNNHLNPFQRLLGLLTLDKRDIYQIFGYAIFAGVVNLSLPLGIQAIINLIQGGQVSTSWIILVIFVVLGVAFAGALQLMQLRITENLQQKIFTRASFEFAYRFPRITLHALTGYYPPELANRFFDTLTVQKGVSKILIDFSSALLQIVFGLILLSFYHPFFIIFGILLLLLIYVIFKYTAPKGLATSLEESKYKYKVAYWLQEIARHVASFKLSGSNDLAMKKNDQLTGKYLSARESHFRILMIQFSQIVGFKVLITAGLLIIGGLLVLEQQMNIGQFVAAEIIIVLVMASVEKLIYGLETFYDVLTSLEKLGQVVDLDLESSQGEQPFNKGTKFSIVLDEVSYKRPGAEQWELEKVSLAIRPGDHIFIQGSHDSGKHSLLNIISGLILPDSGKVFVNEIPLSAIKLSHFRSFIGHALTSDTPFEGTFWQNLVFDRTDITTEEVRWAVKNLGLSDFVKSLPNDLQSHINPDDMHITETVAKKMMLARSIVKKPALIILEDPLDNFEEREAAQIIDFLTDSSHPWALVVVSQNRRWAMNCDRILYMNRGHLVDQTS